MINKVVGVLGLFVILAAAALGGGLGRELGDLTTGPFSRFFEPTPQEIEEYMIEGLETAAEILNRQVPMMVDDFTRMDSVTVGPGAMITYHYSIPGHTSQDWDETFQQEHEATVRQKTCAMEGMKPSLEWGAIYAHAYEGNDGVEITRFEVRQSDCALLITPSQ